MLQVHVPNIFSVFSLMLQVFYVVWPGRAGGRRRGTRCTGRLADGGARAGDGGVAGRGTLEACSSLAGHPDSRVSPTWRVGEREVGVRGRTSGRRDKGGVHSWGGAKADGGVSLKFSLC